MLLQHLHHDNHADQCAYAEDALEVHALPHYTAANSSKSAAQLQCNVTSLKLLMNTVLTNNAQGTVQASKKALNAHTAPLHLATRRCCLQTCAHAAPEQLTGLAVPRSAPSWNWMHRVAACN